MLLGLIFHNEIHSDSSNKWFSNVVVVVFSVVGDLKSIINDQIQLVTSLFGLVFC